MARKTTKRHKHKPFKKARRSPRLPLLIAAMLLICISATLAFLYVDHLVVTRLSSRQLAEAPVVLSQALRVMPDQTFTSETFVNQLQARQYRQVPGSPQFPGEYSISDNTLLLRTREFTNISGHTEKSIELSIDLFKPSFTNLATQTNIPVFHLEPQIVTYLGSADTRKSSYKTLDIFPQFLIQAVLATEDHRFFNHSGIDLVGITRAMLINLRSFRIMQGGSTITQQLAKNMLFSPRRTVARKVLEALAAVSLEKRLSKNRILELYLNEVYLGQSGAVAIHGVAEAAQHFFRKEIEGINLADAALLAGMIRAPSFYSPRRHPLRARQRRDTVLQLMLEQKTITKNQYDLAKSAELDITPLPKTPQTAAHFVSILGKTLDQSLNLFAATASGLAIFTGLDLNLQQCAAQAVGSQLEKLERDFPALKRKTALEAGLVAIEPHSGLVKAWIGGRDFGSNQFDHVSQAKRQVGSTIKPFIYLTALDSTLDPSVAKYSAASVLPDQPIEVRLVTGQIWRPENYDRRYRGQVTFRYALEHSLNLPTVYLAQTLGVPRYARTIRDFGIASTVLEVPALALGAIESSLLELTAAYAALANNGILVNPRLFVTAQEPGGSILTSSRIFERRVASESASYVTTNILQGAVERGTGRTVRQNGWTGLAAGKTGTTNETRDAWFVGYTPTLAVGVWTGFDDNKKLGLTGGRAAAPIWASFMQCAKAFQAEFDFIMPPGTILARLDSTTGQLAAPGCPGENLVEEVFVRGTEPTVPCQVHSTERLDRWQRNGLESKVEPDPTTATRPRRRGLWDYLTGN